MGTQVSWQILLFLIKYPDGPHCPQRHSKTHSSIRISSESALIKSICIWFTIVFYGLLWFTIVYGNFMEFGISSLIYLVTAYKYPRNQPTSWILFPSSGRCHHAPTFWRVFVPQNKGPKKSWSKYHKISIPIPYLSTIYYRDGERM